MASNTTKNEKGLDSKLIDALYDDALLFRRSNITTAVASSTRYDPNKPLKQVLLTGATG